MHSGSTDKRQSLLSMQASLGCVVEAPQKPSAEHVCPGVVQSESSEHGVPGPWLFSATQLPASQKGLAPPFSASQSALVVHSNSSAAAVVVVVAGTMVESWTSWVAVVVIEISVVVSSDKVAVEETSSEMVVSSVVVAGTSDVVDSVRVVASLLAIEVSVEAVLTVTVVSAVAIVEGRHGPALTPLTAMIAKTPVKKEADIMAESE